MPRPSTRDPAQDNRVWSTAAASIAQIPLRKHSCTGHLNLEDILYLPPEPMARRDGAKLAPNPGAQGIGAAVWFQNPEVLHKHILVKLLTMALDSGRRRYLLLH